MRDKKIKEYLDNSYLKGSICGKVLELFVMKSGTPESWDSLEDVIIELINDNGTIKINEVKDKSVCVRYRVELLLRIAEVIRI